MHIFSQLKLKPFKLPQKSLRNADLDDTLRRGMFGWSPGVEERESISLGEQNKRGEQTS